MSEEEINVKMQELVSKVEIICSTNIHILKDNTVLKINSVDENTLTEFVSFCLELRNLYYKEKEKNKKLEDKLVKIKEIIDTSPYTAYTFYGDILYDDESIKQVLEE